jgi:hypothetical protein
MSQPANPCSSCGTTGGYVPPNQARPLRHDGRTYGFAAPICDACRSRQQRRARAVAAAARRAKAARSPHSPAYEPTRAEILGQARALQFGTPWMGRHLVVITPGFTLADLTGRAQVRLMVAEARRQRRASA